MLLTFPQPEPFAEPQAASVASGVLADLPFGELRDRGRRAVESGRLSDALDLFDRALAVARESGEAQQVDLAMANRGAVLISLGRQQEVIPELRGILVANRCPENCFFAAYNLSRAYYRSKQAKKGLFYARIARDRALALENRDWLAAGHNQVGSGLFLESYFEEAEAEYRRALDLGVAEHSVEHSMLLANLGYCLMTLDRGRDGVALALQALRSVRRRGARLYEVWPELFLSYGYLEMERIKSARRHGERALQLAESSGDSELVKNALFMLGEVEKTCGELERAHEHFSLLQQRFYPANPQVVALMVSVEMRNIVNLRA